MSALPSVPAGARFRQFAFGLCEVCYEPLAEGMLNVPGIGSWVMAGRRVVCLDCAAHSNANPLSRANASRRPPGRRAH